MGRRPHALFLVAAASALAGGVLAHAPASAQAQSHSWTAYRDERGTRVDYPRDIFSVARGRGEGGVGHVFESGDGRARMHVYSIPNTNALSPAQFLRSRFPTSRSALSYDRVARNFFAVSSRRGDTIVYLRCNFSGSAGGTLHCVDLRYPAREKRAWDGVVTRISRSLRPLPR